MAIREATARPAPLSQARAAILAVPLRSAAATRQRERDTRWTQVSSNGGSPHFPAGATGSSSTAASPRRCTTVASSTADEQRRRYFFEALLSLTGGSLRGRADPRPGLQRRLLVVAARRGGRRLRARRRRARVLPRAGASSCSRRRGSSAAATASRQATCSSSQLAEQLRRRAVPGPAGPRAPPVRAVRADGPQSARELLVIDTEVSRARASLFELARLYNAADALEGPLVLVPSRQAVFELASALGFRTVALETPHR